MEKEQEEQKDWYHLWRSPILYEPDTEFHQPEIGDRKWIKPPWREWHATPTQIDKNIRYAEKEEKRIDRWKQANRQKTLNGKLIAVPLQSKGNGKPYRGPDWDDECDEQENQDYIPFYFFSWREIPRLSVDARALLETEEDGMVITSEIEKGEWDQQPDAEMYPVFYS